jgi:hypothetical protein
MNKKEAKRCNVFAATIVVTAIFVVTLMNVHVAITHSSAASEHDLTYTEFSRRGAHVSSQQKSGAMRMLLGIFTSEDDGDLQSRDLFRSLLRVHPNVCHLRDYQRWKNTTCELVYVFVVGGNPEAHTELVDDSRPIEVSVAEPSDDTVYLNIRYVLHFFLT